MIRQVQLLIGPLKDTDNGNLSQALNIVSTGSDKDIKISFNVNKSIVGTPNETTLVLTNLSRDTRNRLQTSQTAVEVFFGYVGHELKRVSKGGLLSCVSKRNGPDIETTMMAMDGYGAVLSSFYNKSFSGKVSVQSVVIDIANSLKGVTIGEVNVNGVLANKGRVFNGGTTDHLNSLANNFNFSWSIQDGVFQAIDDKTATSQIYILDSKTNLINVTPILNGKFQALVGVEIVAVLDPRIKPGDLVRVKSEVNPELSNDYKVTECQLSGSSHSGDSKIQIKSLRIL